VPSSIQLIASSDDDPIPVKQVPIYFFLKQTHVDAVVLMVNLTVIVVWMVNKYSLRYFRPIEWPGYKELASIFQHRQIVLLCHV
jgi:hypothetical protein